MIRIIKFVTKEEYIDYAINNEQYSERFEKRDEYYSNPPETIMELIENTIAHYTRRYSGEEMKYAMVENVLENGTVSNSYIACGFVTNEKDRECCNDEFYSCC